MYMFLSCHLCVQEMALQVGCSLQSLLTKVSCSEFIIQVGIYKRKILRKKVRFKKEKKKKKSTKHAIDQEKKVLRSYFFINSHLSTSVTNVNYQRYRVVLIVPSNLNFYLTNCKRKKSKKIILFKFFTCIDYRSPPEEGYRQPKRDTVSALCFSHFQKKKNSGKLKRTNFVNFVSALFRNDIFYKSLSL